MAELNRPLLEEVATYIKDHPEEHDQRTWLNKSHVNACGTTACFAGHTLLLSGQWRLGYSEFGNPHFIDNETGLRLYKTYRYSEDGALLVDPGDFARDLLGLNFEEADRLFYAETHGKDWTVEEAVKEILNGEYRD